MAHNLTQVELIEAILPKSGGILLEKLLAKYFKHIKAIVRELKIQLTKNIDLQVEELLKKCHDCQIDERCAGIRDAS